MWNTIEPIGSHRYRTFWHVTHRGNLADIRRRGLLPSLSRRPAKRVWLADLSLIPWALKHVCDTQGWQPRDCAMLRVCLPVDLVHRHREGVYWCNFVIPVAYLGASVLVNT